MSDLTRVEHFVQDGLGVVSLNRPSKLNVIDEAMVDELSAVLNNFEKSDHVESILIKGNGAKAFCAGGDVVSVINEISSGREVDYFFKKEYQLDQLIHEYSKPVSTFAHGVVFGGGFGLFSAGAQKIASETALFAMPEVTIGFFPDVGSTYFLQNIPRSWKFLMGMCGARINAHWAHLLGLVDFVIPQSFSENIISRNCLSSSFLESSSASFSLETLREFEEVSRMIEVIDDLECFEDFDYWINEALLKSKSGYIKECAENYRNGSLISRVVTWNLYNWSDAKSLAECFSMDLELAKLLGVHHDFHEGVRALLIDKDKSPRFLYRNYSEIPASELEVFLKLLNV